MLSSKTNALLTHTLASFWRKQSCLRMVCQFLLFWRNTGQPVTSNWLFQTSYSENPMEKKYDSSNIFQFLPEEIALFQFPPGVLEEIYFFQKKNNLGLDRNKCTIHCGKLPKYVCTWSWWLQLNWRYLILINNITISSGLYGLGREHVLLRAAVVGM